MSADFWNSSQRTKWQFSKVSLLEARRRVLLLEKKMIQNGLIKDYPNIVYDYSMRIYLHNLLVKFGRRLNIRQIALASAEIYMSRFLTRVLLKEINIYLLVASCLYIACKIEECPQHIRLIVSEARNLWPEYIPHDVTKLAEFEFYLIEEMDLFLILHHPYRSLLQIRDFLLDNQSTYGFTLSEDELQNSWSFINDSYITDLHLIFPPHIIAVAAIYITIVLKKSLASISSKENGALVSDILSIDDNGSDSMSRRHSSTTMHMDDLMALEANPTANNGLFNDKQSNSLGTVDQKLNDNATKVTNFMNFLDHSHVNLDEVVEAVQDLVSLYVAWSRYNENSVKKALQNMLLNRL
ncbi:uncharacterized protein PRCAT00005224001 [Priceomyces carsonii]|uniref:uncharacterized protein n=1 Tax=Priceomyces carsonii TaxID=28549 RepID=UPI002ED8F053|nr:unnamed protein product [Priceomyces carsonii]